MSLLKTIDTFFPGDSLVEVRSFSTKYKTAFSGYFRDKRNLIKELEKHKDKTFYFVFNEIKPECYSREQHEVIAPSKNTTSDNDIRKIDWILIDVDPKRATGISSSDEEKKHSYDMCVKIYNFLRKIGFSKPVSADSGNGYHLMYKVQMTNTQESVDKIKAFLNVIDAFFSDEKASVDTSVFNPSRITKVYSTVSRKGADTSDRPHRRSEILKVPDPVELTSVKLIEKVIAFMPTESETKKQQYQYRSYTGEQFDIRRFIDKHKIRISEEKRFSKGTKLILEECVFNSDHKSPDSAILIRDDGVICYHCFHNSCSSKGWRDVRSLFEPTDREVMQRSDKTWSTKPEPPKKEEKVEDRKSVSSEKKFLTMSEIEQVDSSKIITIPTGFKRMDKAIVGMQKGELSIWSGGNGSGKSSILSQLCVRAINDGFRVAMFSGELTGNRVKNWIHLQAAGRQNVIQSQNMVSYYVDKVKSGKIDSWIGENLFLYNNVHGFKVDEVIKSFKEHMENHPTDMVVFDNLMSFDTSSIGRDKYENQTAIVLKLSELCKIYNVHIHFVCHPRKPNGFLRKYDVGGTADLTNAADNVFMVHRVNKDFKSSASIFFDAQTVQEYENFSNVVEIMKNRAYGVEDVLVGLFFEPNCKRFLNEEHENMVYGWEDQWIEDLEF